jgi:type IV pilus assembly protein PilW
VQPVSSAVSSVMNLKAQFGLDTNNDGTVDTWQPATGNWSAANLPLQPLATWQQIRAVRIAIVTRSDQYEIQVVTPGPLQMFCTTDPCAVSMTLDADAQHYRLQGAGNDDPVPQRAVERAMSRPSRAGCRAIARAASCSSSRCS